MFSSVAHWFGEVYINVWRLLSTSSFRNQQLTLTEAEDAAKIIVRHIKMQPSPIRFLTCSLLAVCLFTFSISGMAFPTTDTIDVPLKGLIRVSDEVMPGMRREKYRVPALTHWPDGRPAPKEAAPYVIIGVPEDQY